MNIKLEIIFFAITALFLLIYGFWMVNTEKRLKRFFLGKKGKDLEDTITELEAQLKKLETAKENTERELAVINAKLKKSIRGLETIRFNPFPDQGSNQSFAIGMMNEDGDGVVLSSLYSRDRMSVFAKPIKNKQSAYELSEEERNAVEMATIK